MRSPELASKLFQLPELPYPTDALEPYIDKQTMQLHHGKHHQTYVSKLNDALEGTSAEVSSIGDILTHVSQYNTAVRNNGGGHYNHTLFWNILSPQSRKDPADGAAQDEFNKVVNDYFGSFGNFKERFKEEALGRFGSGWAWLVVKDGKLDIGSTPNQDNPVMDVSDFKGIPILGLDVWEHAYYLKYQNRRAEYIDAFWNVVNWDEVAKRYYIALNDPLFV